VLLETRTPGGSKRCLCSRGQFVPSASLRRSFRPQCFDRVDSGGAACRQIRGHRRSQEHDRGRAADGHRISGLRSRRNPATRRPPANARKTPARAPTSASAWRMTRTVTPWSSEPRAIRNPISLVRLATICDAAPAPGQGPRRRHPAGALPEFERDRPADASTSVRVHFMLGIACTLLSTFSNLLRKGNRVRQINPRNGEWQIVYVEAIAIRQGDHRKPVVGKSDDE
jgi:hypothetical protein